MPRRVVAVDPLFAQRLEELRGGRSYRDLGRLAGYSGAYIHQLASGRRPPTPEVAAALDRALDAGGELAALVKITHPNGPAASPAGSGTVVAADDSGWGAMLRRTVVMGASALVLHELLGVSAPKLDTHRRRAVDRATVTGLAEVARHYRQAYHSVPASRLLPAAVAHLELVMSLRPADQPDQERVSLATTAGEMAALAGVLLALDAAHARTALGYFDLAWSAARAVDDVDLQAVVLGCRSFALAYGQGDHRAGLDCADLAREVAQTGASRQTRGWVAAAASERAASVGDLQGCQARLDESALALNSTARAEVVWRGIGGFDAGKLRAYMGGDMVRLHRYPHAEVILDEALDHLDETMQRHRATALIDRAEARLGADNVDGACDDAEAALRLVTQVQHTGNFARIEAVADRGVALGASAGRALHREVQLARADHGLPTRWDTA